MILDLHIQSLDGNQCAIFLNGQFHCSASLPIQEEWLIQAIYSAARRSNLEPQAIISHQNLIPSIIPRLKGKPVKPKKLTLEDLFS